MSIGCNGRKRVEHVGVWVREMTLIRRPCTQPRVTIRPRTPALNGGVTKLTGSCGADHAVIYVGPCRFGNIWVHFCTEDGPAVHRRTASDIFSYIYRYQTSYIYIEPDGDGHGPLYNGMCPECRFNRSRMQRPFVERLVLVVKISRL